MQWFCKLDYARKNYRRNRTKKKKLEVKTENCARII